MSQKHDLIDNLVHEYQKYQELYLKGSNRTTTGSLSFTSNSSGVTYHSSSGEWGISFQLYNVLKDYLIEATDINDVNSNMNEVNTVINNLNIDLQNTNYDLLSAIMELYYQGFFNGVQVEGAKALFMDIFQNDDKIDAVNSTTVRVSDTIRSDKTRLADICRLPEYESTNTIIHSGSWSNITKAFDGINHWQNRASRTSFQGRWIGIDLGSAKNIRRWKYNAGKGSGYKSIWNLEYSINGESWLVLDEEAEINEGFITRSGTCNITARYLRLRYMFNNAHGTLYVALLQATEYADADVNGYLYSETGNYVSHDFYSVEKQLDFNFTEARLFLPVIEDESKYVYIPYVSSDGGSTWVQMTEMTSRIYPRDGNYQEKEFKGEVNAGSEFKIKIELKTNQLIIPAKFIGYGLYFLT